MTVDSTGEGSNAPLVPVPIYAQQNEIDEDQIVSAIGFSGLHAALTH
jgi:hypothetical protein